MIMGAAVATRGRARRTVALERGATEGGHERPAEAPVDVNRAGPRGERAVEMPAAQHDLRPHGEVAVAPAAELLVTRDAVARLPIEADARPARDVTPEAHAPLGVDLAVVAGPEAGDRVEIEVPSRFGVREEEAALD